FVPPVSPGSRDYLVPNSELGDSRHIYRYPLQVMGEQILVETPLVGRHQLRNVALAIAAAEELNRQGFSSIKAKSIESGIRQTQWAGRFQVIAARAGWPEIVIDVAHNPAGAWALRSALSERYADRSLIFVFGAMRDKAISEMAEILFPLADRVIATRPANPRAASPEEILQAGARTGVAIDAVEGVEGAVERARSLASAGTVVVITGSIYLVGEAMSIVGAEL
ncbi:MAG: cyanophycin synthetase, partial [Candidatus Sulfotelmatobacter sp.]